MNVSKLSKVELNRAMIWLYCDHLDRMVCDWFQCSLTEFFEDERISDDGMSLEIQVGEWDYDVNFLNGYLAYDLTMALAFEEGLQVDMSKTKTNVNAAYAHSRHKNPLRAICEVLVMIALEKRA